MPLSELLLKERFESIRSQLTSLQSTISLLRQNFWTIYSNYSTNETVPPFIFPTITFFRLEKSLENLIKINLNINPTSDPAKTFVLQNQLTEEAESMLTVIVRLYTSLTQRIAGTGLMNQIETHSISQFEQGTSIKSYQAVDALSYDLVHRILGKEWITKNAYVPFSIFDSEGYSINPVSFVATLPYPDTFRSRFWPVMAHEISHILIHNQVQDFSKSGLQTVRSPKTLGELLFYSIEELLYILKLKNTPNNRDIVISHLTELFCDVIATYTCPILFVTGSLNLPHYLETRDVNLIRVLQTTTHPPSDSRLFAMKAVLDKNGILKNDKLLSDYVASALSLNETKNTKLMSFESYALLKEYNRFSYGLSEKILDFLKKSSIIGIKHSEWSKLQSASSDLIGQTPTMAMNILWQKRLKAISYDKNKDMMQYYISRHNEFQLLENFINSAYQYYVDNIFPKVKQRGRYDIRIDTC